MFFCQDEPVCKSQIYGPLCASDFKACKKDACAQSAASKKAFGVMLKKQSHDLRLAFMGVQVEVQIFGKGATAWFFSVGTILHKIECASKVAKGKRLIRQTKGEWCRRWGVDNFRDVLGNAAH